MQKTFRPIVASLALAFCLAECGQEPSGEFAVQTESNAGDAGDGGDGGDATPTPEEIADLWAFASSDYEPVDDIVDLEGQAKLVLTGEISEVVNGREQGADDSEGGFISPSIGLGVTPSDVAKAPASIPQTIWVEMPRGMRPVEDFQTYLPVGTPVTLYLVPAPGDNEGSNYSRAEAGYPNDTQLWNLASPQGMVVGYESTAADDGVVLPAISEIQPGAAPEDFLPEK